MLASQGFRVALTAMPSWVTCAILCQVAASAIRSRSRRGYRRHRQRPPGGCVQVERARRSEPAGAQVEICRTATLATIQPPALASGSGW